MRPLLTVLLFHFIVLPGIDSHGYSNWHHLGATSLWQFQGINICTNVFTLIEYACVGLLEDNAIEKFGKDGIKVYHREFMTLEWSLSRASEFKLLYQGNN
jgi:hypothetical protein